MRDPHDSQRWRDLSPLVRAKNPLCQWIDRHTNMQCQRPSAIVHHLKDWKDAPHLFFDWANFVAVCLEHHQGGQRGETQGYIYTHTIGPNDAVYLHDGGWPIWRPEYTPPTENDLVYLMATRGGW